MLVIQRLIKRKVLVLGLLAFMFTANAQNKKYISNHKLLAAVLSEKYGIPASVILSVAAIESSGGAGPAARVLNNHFGMEGKNSFVNNKGHKSRYKQYNNAIESYIDFCNVIARKRFYPTLKNNTDPKAWVKAISRAGYSEQPEQWERKVFSVLHSNQL
ncbi:MAG: glucosaminidase domain-containing protein [Bacteroidota bacterium]